MEAKREVKFNKGLHLPKVFMHVISHSFFVVLCFGYVNGLCNCIHSREVMADFWLYMHVIGCIYGPFLNGEVVDELWNYRR